MYNLKTYKVMKELKGTKTEKNLKEAFAGESQARNKYTFYASKARKDGFEQVAAFFEESAQNEKEHAKLWFKYLNDGAVPDTLQNLLEAARGEHYEWSQMYVKMAEEAREEGFTEIAERFELVAEIEHRHYERFMTLWQNIDDEFVFYRNDERKWKCRNCGHIHVGTNAPDVCPVCNHPKAFFELAVRNY